MRRRSCCLLQIILIVAIAAFAAYQWAGAVARHRIEDAVAQRLPGKLGPAKDYKVTASGSLLQIARGELSALTIHGDEVCLRNGLTLQSLDATVRDVSVDVRKSGIRSMGKAEFAASLNQPQLKSYFARNHPDIADADMTLHDGYVTLSARPSVSGFEVRVNAEATPEIRDGRKLVLTVKKVTAGGIGTTDLAREYLQDKLGPLIDTKEWGFDAQLMSVTPTSESITLEGIADLARARAF